MTTQIKNLASLKRAIASPGVQIKVIAHWQPQLVGTVRTPETVQGNGYFFRGPQASDGKVVRMWAETPKASQLRFNPDNTVTYYPDTERSWTLSFSMPETTNNPDGSMTSNTGFKAVVALAVR